ncbi:MAG: hypothetical protein MZV64_62370 [Ignavibacteriales bacterium]|nr:hypothetical protein [Ignavibacteriales bacterium]
MESTIVDAESFHHLVKSHHIVFRDAPPHQRDPVQDAFRGIPQVRSCHPQRRNNRPSSLRLCRACSSCPCRSA